MGWPAYGPGPSSSYHLWGDDEYDMAMDSDIYSQPPPPKKTHFHAECRYPKMRAYHSETEAKQGARTIRAQVEFNHGKFVPLHPFLCPDNEPEHWHLSRS